MIISDSFIFSQIPSIPTFFGLILPNSLASSQILDSGGLSSFHNVLNYLVFFEFFSFSPYFLKIFLDFFDFFDILSVFLFGFVKFYRSLQGSFFPICVKFSRILPNYLGFSRVLSHFLRFFPNSLVFLRIIQDSLQLSGILPNFFGILGFLRIL